MRFRAVATAAWLILLAVFCVDALTPQTLVIAILLDVPIVLAALTRSRRLTATLVAAAIGSDVLAAFLNAAHDGYRWDHLGVADRALSVISIGLVGYLSTVVQERSERVGMLAAQDARARREAALARAASNVRASLSLDLVARAITREALDVFTAHGAAWYPAEPDETAYVARAGEPEVGVAADRGASELLSIAQRAHDDGAPVAVRGDDALGRFVLDRIGAKSALALSVDDRNRSFGMLLVWFDTAEPFEENLDASARAYARLATSALTQARLFAQLAERNDALSQRTAVIRDLVYALSHDLRTPLAALGMTLRQAKDGAYGALPATYGDVIDASAVAIDDLQRLAETLLLVARFEAGERNPERTNIDLAVLARQIVAEFRAVADTRKIAFDATTDSHVQVLADRGEIRRAIANLVANAFQHTPDGGTVNVLVLRNDASITVAVEDDGFGVDPSMRAALFERFATGSTRAGGGTGLGLSIVRRIAEAYGGTASYEARTPRGSRFAFSIATLA